LEERRGRNPIVAFLEQFTEVMVIVLIVAAVISFIVGETVDAIMILVIVILNAILGFSQEYRAERAMAALRRLAIPTVRVRRGGEVQEIESLDLVPGDIILLEAGMRVPADARVLESVNLRIEEAALTGESVPVEKAEDAIEGSGIPLGDRRNMAYMGTTVSYGRGTAVITGTGMGTELGNIASMLQTVSEEKTPLQGRMAELGKWLAIIALVIVAIVFIEGVVLGGEDWEDMFLIAISLAVAAVPEGLPAVVTISLALGAQRMVRRRALIRRLPAVETLGSVTTICSDKTGTLTENRMTVTVLDVAGDSATVSQYLRRSQPSLLRENGEKIPEPDRDFGLLLAGAALANDATLKADEESESREYTAVGDPTEGALVVAAARLGLWKSEMEQYMPRVAEVPFTSERKRMTTVHRVPGPEECDHAAVCFVRDLTNAPYLAFTKGSVDELVKVCDRVWNDGEIVPMTGEWAERIQTANNDLAKDGMRVLGVAMRPMEANPEGQGEDELERELVFIGMTGMIDPPREEARQAVAECRTAGIRPVMITGDHPLTALNIARQLGIVGAEVENPRVVTGTELAEMSVDDLETIVEDVAVYARVSPEHKVKIVEALKDRGHIVSMTGDGVNDAPALKRADIGVAMGITGTDVSKEASDMILLDDNFATIVNAVEEGRTIYDNIRKFVRYIVSCNVGEILLMLLAPLFNLPVPLTAVQLLWINLVTDGLPALALGIEPAAPDVMDRPPHAPDESILARGLGMYIVWVGIVLGLLSFAAQVIGISWMNTDAWQKMVFTTLGLAQMSNVLSVRAERRSVFSVGFFTNPALIGAVLLTIVLQMLVVYVPFLQSVFDTRPLNLSEMAVTIGLSILLFIILEVVKAVQREADEPARGEA
ncbi:MAG: cation-translocating P-type ATPase, partial [Chloroflexi bacterium]|nr:cation-translocating P-type ATPase [Chloroflexota bacterium]